MQPKIKSKVICTDGEIGEVSRVIVDPLTKEISHLVVKLNRAIRRMIERELVIPMQGNVSSCTEEQIRLNLPSDSLNQFKALRRGDYLTVKEIEIPHLERHLDVDPGEALVPVPALEKNIERRTFLSRFTNAIGAVMAFSLVYPAFRYVIHPMYQPFDNSWIRLTEVSQLVLVDKPRLIKYSKTLKEGFLEREITKSHWAMKASPELLSKVYGDRHLEFHGADGKLIWVNRNDVDIVVFSGKCPHLGCAYRRRTHKRFGRVFVCPCHLSVFESSGEVLDGPSPRGLDVLPVRITAGGDIEIIDVEFKAGKKEPIRIV